MLGYPRRRAPLLATTLAAILVVAALAPGRAGAQTNPEITDSTGNAAADHVPEGLSASDWSNIRAVYEAHHHAAFAVDGGHQVHNPGTHWRTRFDGRGFLTTSHAGRWSWGLDLVCYGRAGAEQAVTAPSCIETDGGRVSYQWDEVLTEWYVNDPHGLEHGYTVHRQPGSFTGETPVPSLQLTLVVRGDLRPRVSAGGRDVTFVNGVGTAVVNYHGLTVLDADGVALPAWFDVSSEALVLSVDDRGARYPLTIDPVAQQAYLKASNTSLLDEFGVSVAVSGDTVVVGAWQEDSIATGVNGNQLNDSTPCSGAAYVFVRDAGGVWSQQAYLKASNTDAFDSFGRSVAVSGDTVVVGALAEDSSATGVDGNQADNSAQLSGAAYVFVRDGGGVWSQQAYLKASNTDFNDQFGRSVAVSGDTVVVGAIGEDSSATGVGGNQADNSAFDVGAAYVFVRDAGGVWSQQAYLKASNSEAFGFGDQFGFSVAVSGNTVVVGAWQEDSSATGVDGNQADNSAPEAGAAYVFVRDTGGIWSQQAYLKASNTDLGDVFGISVAASGDTVVVGAYLEDSSAAGVNGNQADNSAGDAGAAYCFVRDGGGVWSQQAYIKASNTDQDDRFGESVAISGDTVVIGASQEDSIATGVNGNQADNSATGAGAAYCFVRDAAGVWSQQDYIKASNTDSGDQFGDSVAVSGDTVLVGAFLEDSRATGVNGNQADNIETFAGAAYVFVPSDCNANGIPDETDIANGTSQDIIGAGGLPDGVPDECQSNCNGNLIPDDLDIANGTSQDCNTDDVPDECDIAAGTSPDCNANGIPDECDVVVTDITEIIDCTGDGTGDCFSMGNSLRAPGGLALDGGGNVYVTGLFSDNAFKITPDGVISEIIDATGDGAGNGLDGPAGIVVHVGGDVYLTGRDGSNAFKITPSGVITQIIDATGDGAGNGLSFPFRIAVDVAGNAYVTGFGSSNAFKITPSGVITQIIDATGDGAGNVLAQSLGIAVDAAGNVYVSGFGSDNAFKITPAGVVTEIIDATGDGAGRSLRSAFDIAVDAADNVYVVGSGSENAFKITPSGAITEIINRAGDGTANPLFQPGGIAVDAAGNAYVYGGLSDNAFEIMPSGVITEIIDTTGDGAGNGLRRPQGIAVNDDAGIVYVAGGLGSDNAFRITLPNSLDCNTNGIPDGCELATNDCNANGTPDDCDITAGTSLDCNANSIPDDCDLAPTDPDGNGQVSPDCNANDVPDECDAAKTIITEIIDATGDGTGNVLNAPFAIAVDAAGNVYLTGFLSDNAFKITPVGIITQIIDAAGDGAGNVLDGVAGIAVDGAGNVYVTGQFSANAFKITPAGVITEIIDATGDGAGNGLNNPVGIAVDGAGNVYVTGQFSINAFKITPVGAITEIIDRAGDGAGNLLGGPRGITVDGAGNAYLTGAGSNNVFKITPAGVITEIIDRFGDGAGNTLSTPFGIAMDAAGNVYVMGLNSDNAFKITPAGVITEIIDATGDGAGNGLDRPRGIAVDGAGNVYVTGQFSANAFKITPVGVITEIIDATGDGAGNGLFSPEGIAVDGAGNAYVTGSASDKTFKIIASDCNTNGIPDECDITNGTSIDSVGTNGLADGVPDECQFDCNGNLIPDKLDVAAGSSLDCNLNGIPDECETCGDLDGDGDVDAGDFTRFLGAFGLGTGAVGFEPCADSDGDGAITFVDYQQWLQCFRAFTGSPFAPPPMPAGVGDMDRSGGVDGRDIQPFVDAMLAPATAGLRARFLADVNGDGAVDSADAGKFVGLLLSQ